MISIVIAAIVVINVLGAFIGSWCIARNYLWWGYWLYIANGIEMIFLNALLIYMHPEQWPLFLYITLAIWFVIQGKHGLKRLKEEDARVVELADTQD